MEGAGRKNRLASLHGPYSHEWLNPCHPLQCRCASPLSAAVQVSQLRRRPEPLAETQRHRSSAEGAECPDWLLRRLLRKGHVALHNRLAGAGVERLGKRHTARFLSDAYCKGIVRGQVECCNLRAHHVEDACVASERFSATNFTSFPGREFLHMVQRACGDLGAEATRSGTRATARGRRLTHLRDLDIAQAYGLRPRSADPWHVSPYEFVMCWEMVATRVPYTWQAWQALPADAWDVNLTARAKKFENAQKVVRLKPGADYTNKFNSKPNCEYFANSVATAALQHAWCFKCRRRPQCPRFDAASCPRHGPESAEYNAALCDAYFRPWTLQKRWSTPQVPLASCLKGGNESWDEALRRRLRVINCEETMRHVGNFLSVHRVRPSEEAAENSDDDDADTALDLTAEHFRQALEPPARELAAGTKRKLASEELTVAACERAIATWASAESDCGGSQQPRGEGERLARRSCAAAQPSRQGVFEPRATRVCSCSCGAGYSRRKHGRSRKSIPQVTDRAAAVGSARRPRNGKVSRVETDPHRTVRWRLAMATRNTVQSCRLAGRETQFITQLA